LWHSRPFCPPKLPYNHTIPPHDLIKFIGRKVFPSSYLRSCIDTSLGDISDLSTPSSVLPSAISNFASHSPYMGTLAGENVPTPRANTRLSAISVPLEQAKPPSRGVVHRASNLHFQIASSTSPYRAPQHFIFTPSQSQTGLLRG